jgi:signal transduction histidine kinase
LLFSLGDSPVVTPTYRSGSLYLKSAFAPLKGLQDYVIAVLGVEANVDYFDSLAQLRRNLYYASGLSLLGGILLGIVFLLLQRRISLAEEKLFLQETHSHLGRMVAVVAHELKNPLMIMRAAAERLKKKTDQPEADFVVEEVDRLNGIVSGYLDFARAGGSLVSNDGPVQIDLADLLGSTRAHLIQKYSEVDIDWLGPTDFPHLKISGYPRSLRQVVLNLLINAVEACREVGRPVAVGLELEDNREHIEIVVRDKGPGFAPKDLKNAFEPFYSSKRTGSGLGLYLSRTIVRQMGGDVEIKSQPDVETVVTVTLPKNQETHHGENSGS